MVRKIIGMIILAIILIGMAQASEGEAQPTTESPTTAVLATTDPSPTATPDPVMTTPIWLRQAGGNPGNPAETSAGPVPAATPDPRLDPRDWSDWPVVPAVSASVQGINERGRALGRDPRAFAKVGDCGSAASWFLGAFDDPPAYYRLGEYAYLEAVIAHFRGSFGRTSVAARPGFNASALFAPLWSDPAQCQPGEAPLACELRVTNASYAFIMLGSNDVWQADQFEPQMRRMLDTLIENGVVPILATRPDAADGDDPINAALAGLAYEYDLPLWNLWRAVQPLPNRGLEADGAHLSWAPNRFDDRRAMQRGWPWRNLTALQVLDAVWRSVDG